MGDSSGMASNRSGKWPGGYTREDAQGRQVHVIRRSIGGVRYEVSTGCTTLRAAMRELEKFESDPPGYRTGGDPSGAIFLDDQLVADFLADHASNSTRWLRQQQLLLGWWADHLRGVDLRRATLAGHILPALKRQKWVPKKQVMIKRLFAWLREEDRIAAAEDPTLGKMKVAPSKPAQLDVSKVIPALHFERARLHMVGHYRDALDLLAGTGWHLSEAQRFAEGGVIEETREGETVLMVRHKSGAPHRTLVSPEVAAAAKRLRAHGSLSDSQLGKALTRACDAAEVPRFKAGWFRHTIATIATDAGQEALVPGFLGHRSASTTRRFYAVRVTPPKVKTLR